eukprot:868275-Prorocentrum_minimum.AAC.1
MLAPLALHTAHPLYAFLALRVIMVCIMVLRIYVAEEGRVDVPGAGTNGRRDGKMYPGREPIGGGTGGSSSKG